ncbi:MAG: heparinase II/III family protein [Halobacteriales archaeon]
MRNQFDHAYPPGDWSVADLAEAFEEPAPPSSLPRRPDRDAWQAIESSDVTAPLARAARESAEAAAADPVPGITASTIRRYVDGDDVARSTYQSRFDSLRDRLTTFALAECLDDAGAYLDGVLDYAWRLCELTSWVHPGNLDRRGHEKEFADGLARSQPAPEHTSIDLASSDVAFRLAEVDYLLGDALNAGLRERIRTEVERRVIAPYEARADYWWLDPPTNNWNAACNANSLGAALYLVEDPERLARLTAKAASSLEAYLKGFGGDGGTVEGVGYWNFGVGQYVTLADMLETRTGGRFSLFDVPVLEAIAAFPVRAELSPGRYPAFSDADEATTIDPAVATRLGERFDHPGLLALANEALGADGPADLLSARALAWCRDLPEVDRPVPAERTFFEDIEWWLVRQTPEEPDGLAVAAKGGDNAESHNHNDCGSFVVHYRGESLLTDLGSPAYSKSYFDPEERYDFFAARSLGHSVPYPNGTEQEPMPDRYDEEAGLYLREMREPSPADTPNATVVETSTGDTERFVLDLADCYPPAADLDSLERSFAFDREAGRLSVADRAEFGDPGRLESMLVSYVPMEADDAGLVVEGDRGRARVETAADVEVERTEDAVPVDRSTDPPEARDVWRARLGPVASNGDGVARIAFEVTTAPVA